MIWTCSARFFGLEAPPFQPNTLCVTQEEYQHDTAVANIFAADVNADSLVSGMPMTLAFGYKNLQRAFHGYVNHVERISNRLAGAASATDKNSVNVFCVGASWPMKQPGTRAWFNRTSAQVVAEIAQLFGLSADIDNTTDQTIWPSLQMAGQTYWEFCVHLAQTIGYTFYCNGIQLVFRPRKINPVQLTGNVVSFDVKADPARMPIFTPMLGVNSPPGGQMFNRQATGLDPRTGTVIYSQVAGGPSPVSMGALLEVPTFDKINHFPARTRQELSAQNEGEGAVNQLYITAKAYAAGDPEVTQGSLIAVQNANGAQNGLWYVTKACHEMEATEYSMSLCLGRDSLGGAVLAHAPRTGTQPVPMLVQGKWLAA